MLPEKEPADAGAQGDQPIDDFFELGEKFRRVSAAETGKAKDTRLIRMRVHAFEVAIDLIARLRRGNGFLCIRRVGPQRLHSRHGLILFQLRERPRIHVPGRRAVRETDGVR